MSGVARRPALPARNSRREREKVMNGVPKESQRREERKPRNTRNTRREPSDRLSSLLSCISCISWFLLFRLSPDLAGDADVGVDVRQHAVVPHEARAL